MKVSENPSDAPNAAQPPVPPVAKATTFVQNAAFVTLAVVAYVVAAFLILNGLFYTDTSVYNVGRWFSSLGPYRTLLGVSALVGFILLPKNRIGYVPLGVGGVLILFDIIEAAIWATRISDPSEFVQGAAFMVIRDAGAFLLLVGGSYGIYRLKANLSHDWYRLSSYRSFSNQFQHRATVPLYVVSVLLAIIAYAASVFLIFSGLIEIAFAARGWFWGAGLTRILLGIILPIQLIFLPRRLIWVAALTAAVGFVLVLVRDIWPDSNYGNPYYGLASLKQNSTLQLDWTTFGLLIAGILGVGYLKPRTAAGRGATGVGVASRLAWFSTVFTIVLGGALLMMPLSMLAPIAPARGVVDRAVLISAERGEAAAQYTLGVYYSRITSAAGTPLPNDPESAKWMRRAADQGHAKAQTALGQRYLDGVGVASNRVLAYMWFSLAAAQGETEAAAAVGSASFLDKLSTDQIAEAQRLVREFTPKLER